MRGQKKHRYTALYIAIAVCLLASGAAVYGLLNRIDAYRESEDTYADLQSQALLTIAPTADASASPLETAATGSAADPNDITEGEEIEDDALLWLLENQNSTWNIDTPEASEGVTAVDTAPAPEVTPATEATGDGATATPVPPSLSATAVLSSTPTPAITPVPTFTPVPEYIPKQGISMERAVKYDSARYYVDFGYLTRINPEVVGWLVQESTDINYPVMRGEDNAYYLDHMMDGTKNSNGSLFLDCGNSAAFVDAASYIYGHNAKNGGMFALLSNYLEQGYYEAHPQMLLVSPFADYQIDLFAGIQTTVNDETSWRLKTFDDSEAFDEYVDGLCAQSIFTADKALRPLWGDRLLVLVTCTNLEHGERYVIYGRMRPIVYESAEAVEITKRELDEQPTDSGYKKLGELGEFMVYFQNDPIWADMRYESRAYNNARKFGDGGCGPTAVATAIANMVAPEKLPLLVGYADYSLGYTFCQCSVNRYYCNHQHAQYQLRSADEFLRYFPLAVANYASGNNMWEIQSRTGASGTNMRFLESLCLIYRIRLTATRKLDKGLEMLKQGDCLAVVSVGSGPFTSRGHYLVMAGVDEEYLYIIDPNRSESYKGSGAKLIEILEPGIARVRLEDAERCGFSTMYILEKTNET